MKKLLFILVLHCILAVGIEAEAQEKWREVWISRADTNLVRYEIIKPDPEFANDWIEYKTTGKVIYVDDGRRIFECSKDSVYYVLRFLPDSVGQKFIRHLFRSILMEKELDEAVRESNARYYENLLEEKEYIRKVPKKEGEGQGLSGDKFYEYEAMAQTNDSTYFVLRVNEDYDTTCIKFEVLPHPNRSSPSNCGYEAVTSYFGYLYGWLNNIAKLEFEQIYFKCIKRVINIPVTEFPFGSIFSTHISYRK